MLRSGRDRINYLLVREAKIIAMTCTHAALKRKDLVDLAFKVCVSSRYSRAARGSIVKYLLRIMHTEALTVALLLVLVYSLVIISPLNRILRHLSTKGLIALYRIYRAPPPPV